MLAQTIKDAFMIAFKEKDFDKKNLLGLVKGDILLLEKEGSVDDSQVVKIIKKYLKGITESLSIRLDEKLEREKNILESFLPQTLTELEIENIIQSLDDKSIKSVMTYFSTYYNGRVDNRVVMDVVRRQTV